MVAIVITSGIYSSLNWLYAPTELTRTAWGSALLVKLLLVAVLLLIGLAHQITVNPERYRQWAGRLERIGSLAFTLRLEVIVALFVLVTVANLSATPVPPPNFLNDLPPAPAAAQNIGDLAINMAISPGGPGVNMFDTLVTRADQPLEGADVRMQIVNPALDWRSTWLDAEAVDSGLYVTAGADIYREGRWLTLVDVTTPGGKPVRAAFEWAITNEASVIQTRNPGVLNVVALVAVMLALGWAALPSLRQFAHWLDWSPTSIAIATSATVVTALFMVAGYVIIQQSEADYELTLNPLPQIVNPVLPNQQSLVAGAALYEQYCAAWGQASDLDALKERLPHLRDEQLFTLTRDGGRGLPACENTISDEQRWNIVNYLRTLGT
jgi:mono/diheme cytochrome c family protein